MTRMGTDLLLDNVDALEQELAGWLRSLTRASVCTSVRNARCAMFTRLRLPA